MLPSNCYLHCMLKLTEFKFDPKRDPFFPIAGCKNDNQGENRLPHCIAISAPCLLKNLSNFQLYSGQGTSFFLLHLIPLFEKNAYSLVFLKM